MKENIIRIIKDSCDLKEKLIDSEKNLNKIIKIVEIIYNSFREGNSVYFCGNGGSAADAQHLAAEFSGRFYSDRKAYPSFALHSNSSYVTAVGNDYGFENIYSRIIDGIGKKGDVLVCISTSGNSENLLRAAKVAKKNKVHTISLTGNNLSSGLNLHSDITVNVDSNDTPRIQETHILIGHIICELVEKKLISNE